MTWTTITSYIDIETGEALTIRHIDKQLYVKVKLETKYKIHDENNGTRYNIWKCERNRQTEIEF